MPDQYIGEKKVANIIDSGTKTHGGVSVVAVLYEDGTKEMISSLMMDKIVSETSCDLTELREKRLNPVVEQVLNVLRDWVVKFNELQYMSMLLNQSLEFNQKEALIKLWGAWGPKLISPEDVDLITVDNVLRSQTIDEAIKNSNENK